MIQVKRVMRGVIQPSPELIERAVLTRKNTEVSLAGMACGPR